MADHERKDISLRPIARLGVMFVAGMAALHLTMVLVYGALLKRDRAPDARPPAWAKAAKLPPEPRLESDSTANLKALREEEDRTLGSYGWADRNAGVARIPIERAIELYVKKKETGHAANPGA